MGLMILRALVASDLPAVSALLSPEAMLLTSVTLACLGLVVMLLSRRRGQVVDPEDPMPRGEACLAAVLEPKQKPPLRAPEPQGTFAVGLQTTPPEPVGCAAAAGAQFAAAVTTLPERSELAHLNSADAALEPAHPRVQSIPGKSADTQIATPPTPAPACGASALIAKAAQLLPQVFTPPAGHAARPRIARGPGGFQPGARFSRSQQAFLRVPVALTGSDESGVPFREESGTLILLPQGAVLPMKQRVRPGDRLGLFSSSRQMEVPCTVFGALQGKDGKMLVEIEFAEPQKHFWPVSFPAWAGNSPGNTAGSTATGPASPERTPALDSPGT